MNRLTNSQLAEHQLQSPHYLKSVTELGDDQPLITSREVYSSQGIKLLNAGVNVNSSLYEHLLHHKLIPKLDECLTTDVTFNKQMLVDDATYLMAFDKRLDIMRAALPNDNLLTDILKNIPLNPVIAFKLTVMRSKHPDLLRRSIYVALVSIYIGIQSGLNQQNLVQLATAALLHDIGILHIDPDLLGSSHHMTEAERHHLYVHPIIGWMLLKEYREYSDKVLDAVLQHHERLDGSGYPSNLQGDKIGQFGQIIAVAEIVTSRYGRDDTQYNWLRLETILKLNSRRYGQHLIGHLGIFYQEETEVPPITEEGKEVARQHLLAISAVLKGWELMREKCAHSNLSDFINHRMQGLKMEVLDAGLNPYSIEENIIGIEDDPRACAEARILLDETIWQIHGILHEIKRRWPDIDCNKSPHNLQPVCNWINDVENLLQPA